jgi:putative flavoprotein involved in K+ transport
MKQAMFRFELLFLFALYIESSQYSRYRRYCMTTPYDVLVLGGGQAGLAAGYYLQRAGLSFAILEGTSGAGGSWAHYYDSLRLFSPAGRSSLPGMPFPGKPYHYPTRDEVVAYLRHYARHFELPVVTDARVVRVERIATGFHVRTSGGTIYHARSIIAATGAFHRPYLPSLPGQDAFAGRLLHAATYRNPTSFEGQRVLVVGAGNSAIQIAVELAKVAHVTLATREPIRFRRQKLLGQDIHHWAWLLGLDRLPLGIFSGKAAASGVLDTGVYQAAIAAGQPDRRPLFTRFTSAGVVWPDRTAEPIDTVIYATGYRPNLDYLADLGALDADGQPLHRRGISTTVPGLAYVGLSNQWTYASATIRGVGPDATYIVQRLQRYLRQVAPAPAEQASLLQHMFGSWRCCTGKEGAV